MGNRAVIAHVKAPKIGIYLHWNGGVESVLAFLEAAKQKGVRTGDPSYGMARLTQIIGEFFSADGEYETPLGIGVLSDLDIDNGDNGLYWINEKFEIEKREYVSEHQSAARSVDDLSKDGRTYYEAVLAEVLESLHKPEVEKVE